MELSWEEKKFSDLSTGQLYKILELRSEVFIVEQTCVYQDIDGMDLRAFHVLGWKNNDLVAYSRVLHAEGMNDVVIGRVIVRESYRNKKLGGQLMEKTLEVCQNYFEGEPLQMNAQKHLEKYYAKHGFIKEGEPFLEDGIPHIRMIKNQY